MPNATLGEVPVDALVSIRRDDTGDEVGHGLFTASQGPRSVVDFGETVYVGPVDHFGTPKRMKVRVIIDSMNPRPDAEGGVAGTFILAGQPTWVR